MDNKPTANNMTPRQLLRLVDRLEEETPRHLVLESKLAVGVGFGDAWYSSQKEHWQTWLRGYDGPGAYGREVRSDRTAKFAYNHIRCAPMLFWLAEAAAVPDGALDRAYGAVTSADRNCGTQCRMLRDEIPWQAVFESLMS